MSIPPLVSRTFAIAAVAVLLLVPIRMISGKVSERQSRADSVSAQFAAETVGPQVIAGPMLVLTCEETSREGHVLDGYCPDGVFFPRTLSIAGEMPVETRRRGIYDVHLYHAALELKGEFEWPAPPEAGGLAKRAWKRAFIATQVSDPRGIKAVEGPFAATEGPDGKLAGQDFAIKQRIGDVSARKTGDRLAFAYRLRVDGTSSLQVAPVGAATEIRLRSTWPHPSFTGGMSPDERSVDASGFQATWRATSLSTGGSGFWESLVRKDGLTAPPRAAGVAIFQPVNIYSLSYRATEYAFLFILFTFTALALLDTLARVRLHAIQYALVGSAIAVFFLLLLAISEHAPFTFAYAAGATACTVLMTVYLRHPLRSALRTAAFGALFAGVYAMLYVLLMREDDALLAGSLMVFALLAAAMLATRKVDWSAPGLVTSRNA
jgi:inner membrane protein